MKRYRAIAEYYDADIADSRMLQEDVPFFLGQLPRKRQSILELCVGTGRAAIPLVQAGHRVVGVDYAQDMLDIAVRKRDSVGISEKQLGLIQADVLELDLGRTFDWICIFFNTLLGFPTLEEQDRLLGMVRRHLAARGRFWIDIFQPDLALLSRGHCKGLGPKLFHVAELDRTVFQTTEIKPDCSRQIQDMTFHFTWFDAKGREHREKTVFQMTWLSVRELQLLLERNGMQLEATFGNYDGSAVTADSPRIIARAMRK